jgi:hypothetical protein
MSRQSKSQRNSMTTVASPNKPVSPEEMEKAKQLAEDPELIERVQKALKEIQAGKTVSLADLPKAIARKRAKLREAEAREASTA